MKEQYMDEQKMAEKCEGGTCGSCATCVAGKENKCSPMHWACCIAPMLSLVFWVAGIVSLVLAWSAGDGMIWGKADAFWYLNALSLGVLAMGGRGKKIGSCRKGSCGSGAHGDCKEGSCK